MTKTTQIKEINKIKKIILSDGTKVEFDPKLANGHLLMKCRELSGGMSTVIYMLSEIATFDGKKLPAPEILNFSAFDIIDLETAWAHSLGK